MSNTGAIPAFFVLLRSGIETDQRDAAHALLATEEQSALEGILEAYHHFGSALRDELECYAERFIPALAGMVHNENDQIRFNCVEFLSRPRAGATTHLLGLYVGDKNPQVATLAMSGLEGAAVRFFTPKDNELRDESCAAYAACRAICDGYTGDEQVLAGFDGVINALTTALDTGTRTHGRRLFDLLVRMGRRGDAVVLHALRAPAGKRAHQLIVRELEANPRPSTVILALTLLASGSSALRRLALNVLARCEREDDTALMIEALRYAGPDVTGRIVRRMKTIPWMRAVQDSLEQVGEESVVAWVEALVSSSTNGDIGKKLLLLRRCIAIKSELVAKTVIGAMTQHYSSLVRPVLMELREHPYEPVRYYALAALSRTSFDGKHTILKEQLGSDSARIRALAANAIVTNQFDELFARFDAMSEERRRESTSLIKRIDPMLFDKLSERLNSRDVEERLKVLRILTYTGVDEKIEEDLIRAAEDANSRVRASVPYILGRVASPDAARSVLMLLKDFDTRVRANAVEGIELTGRSAFAKVLVPFLGSGIARVRANAAKAMFTLGSQRAQAILDAMAISRQEDMRLAAVWALTRIGSELTVENALETALRERNQILQRRMMAFIELAQELRREQEKRAASRRLRVVA